MTKAKRLTKSELKSIAEKVDFPAAESVNGVFGGELVHNLSKIGKLAIISQKLHLNCNLGFDKDGMTLFCSNELIKTRYHVSNKKIKNYFCEKPTTFSFDYETCVSVFYDNVNYKNLQSINFDSQDGDTLDIVFTFAGGMNKNCVLSDSIPLTHKYEEPSAYATKRFTYDQFRGLFISSSKKPSTVQFKAEHNADNMSISIKNKSGESNIKLPITYPLDSFDVNCDISMLTIVNGLRIESEFDFTFYKDHVGFVYKTETYDLLIVIEKLTNGDASDVLSLYPLTLEP